MSACPASYQDVEGYFSTKKPVSTGLSCGQPEKRFILIALFYCYVLFGFLFQSRLKEFYCVLIGISRELLAVFRVTRIGKGVIGIIRLND